MRLGIKSSEDFWSGLMFIGFGLLAVIVARDYPMGTAMRMGPGYFPTYLGAILIVIGAVIAARSTRVQGEGIGSWAWRAMLMLCIAFVTYGLSMETFELGFIPSIVAVVVLSALATREFKLIEVIFLAAVLAVLTTGLFIYGIELPYPLFWWR